MNTGTISARYARALLLRVKQSGRGEEVFSQARRLLSCGGEIPSPLEKDIESLCALLLRNGRVEYLKFILASFVGMYCREEGISVVTLRTAFPSEEIEKRIGEIFSSDRVIIETRVEKDLLGGFVLECDDRIADASVKRKLDLIRSRFEESNKRIV